MGVLKKITRKNGFTIVELVVVISIIGILATISVVGYGAWKNSAIATQLKSDLNAVAAAMENARTFNDGYPTTLPTTVTPSENITLTLQSGSSATDYCVDGVSSDNATLTYYVASETKDQGALEGTCATRPGQAVPSAPTNLAITSQTSTTLSLSWTASATGSPTSYTAQCASDAGFILGPQQSTQATTATTVTGLGAATTHYCRVQATNGAGNSAWSSAISTETGAHSCSDTSQYGTYPDCYEYDALPIATSIEGYWTTAPDGFLLEDGSEVSRTTYADLFATIGTTYGAGDGSTTFNLPDSRGRTVVNRSASDTEFDSVGETGGVKADIQTIAQLPSHTHTQNSHSHNYDIHASGSEAGGYGLPVSGSFQNRVYVTAGNSTYGATATNQTTGGGSAHNVVQPSIVKSFAIKYHPTTGTNSLLPEATSIKGYWTSPPTGYLLEDGSAVSRTTYADLFAAVGTTYGAGDGSTTFNLPDSRGRASVNKSASDTEFDTIGEKYGEKTHVMTVAEMPAHTHIQDAHSHGFYSYVSSSEAANYAAQSGGNWVNAFLVNGCCYGTSGATATNQSTGSNTAETVLQPYIVQKAAIKYTAATGTGSAVSTGTSLPGYWTSAPTGYLVEDGSAVSRTTYAALFAVIGTTHGAGNGSTTFNLPDSRGRIGVDLSPSDSEFNTMGEKYGEKTHLMTLAEMATHNHTQDAHSHGFGVAPAGGNVGLCNGCSPFKNRVMVTGGGIGSYSTTATNNSTGGGQAFNVIQPSIVKLFVIKY